jgi:hypothetical protein
MKYGTTILNWAEHVKGADHFSAIGMLLAGEIIKCFSDADIDGVAKTHQLLRCCNCSRCFDVRKYASLLDNRAPCIWRFLLSHLLFCFLAKASYWTEILVYSKGKKTGLTLKDGALSERRGA